MIRGSFYKFNRSFKNLKMWYFDSIQHYNKVIRQKCEGGHSMLGPDITLSDLKRYGQYLKENYLEEREDRRDIFRVSHIGCVADQYWILSEKVST